MPRGISESFLRLLETERPRAMRALVAASVFALLALALAELADAPRLGRDSRVFLLALASGVGLGVLLARRQATRLLLALRDRWSHAMREMSGAKDLAEANRRLSGGVAWPAWALPTLAVALALANVALFAMLWQDAPAAASTSLVVLVVDGLVLGAWLGSAAYRLGFARLVVREVDTLVARGTVGVWGEA